MTLLFGLTGGIGSGKSTVARHLRTLGVTVVDADALAREVVLPGSMGLLEVAATFGSEVLLPDGTLNRPALGKLIFEDSLARAVLNDILHPKIQKLAVKAVQEASTPLVAYDAPLLFETGLATSYAPVVVVTAPLEARRQRVMARDGLTAEEFEARDHAQMPLKEKALQADYVIDNNQDEAFLVKQTRLLLTLLTK